MIEKISEYNFDDILIGLKKEFRVRITESIVEDFAKLSGDYNPLHMDQNYAKSTKFGNRIAHGMLLSFISLAGTFNTLAIKLYNFSVII